MIRYDTIRYDTIRYNIIHYDAIKCTALHYNTDRYNTTLHHNAIPIYNTIHNTIQYSTLQYNTIFYTTLQYRHSTMQCLQCTTQHYTTPPEIPVRMIGLSRAHAQYESGTKRGSVHAVQRAVDNALETPSERLKVMLLEAGKNASRWAGKF